MSASISARSWRRSCAARSAARLGWHYGFAAAGIGMLVGDSRSISRGMRQLPPDELHRARAGTRSRSAVRSRDERRAIVGLLCVFALVAFFWATYDQQGNTLLLWAEDFTDRRDQSRLLAGRDPDHLVPRAQSADDFHLHADPHQAVGAGRRSSARELIDHRQDGVRLPLRRARQSGDGGGRLATVAPAAKASPLWLVGYFIDRDDRRTASRAGRPRADLAPRAGRACSR